MNDTHPEISKKMSEMIQEKSPEERLRMGSSMYDLSKQLVIQALLRDDPNLSPTDLRVGIFKRFYGEDYPPETAEKIIQHLRRM